MAEQKDLVREFKLNELITEINNYLRELGQPAITIELFSGMTEGDVVQRAQQMAARLREEWKETIPLWDLPAKMAADLGVEEWKIPEVPKPETIAEGLPSGEKPPEEPTVGQVIVPGKLVLMPDGTYQDYQSSLPVNAEVASRIIREYEVSGDERWAPGRAEWQTEQAFAREQFEWQVSEAALASQQSQREQDLSQRLRLERELGELGGPSDWIKRWEMIHGVIPRAEAEMARQQGMALLNQAQMLPLYGTERANLEQQAYEAFNLADIVTVTQADQSLVNEGNNLMSQARQSTGAERMMMEVQAEQLFSKAARLREKAQMAETPPTPEWLPQFLQPTTGKKGEVTTLQAGEPIEQRRIQTPSGQQWAQTPWSVREGLRGFSEFSGFRPMADILDEMAMMQTRTPVGAGRTRWTPAQQRA